MSDKQNTLASKNFLLYTAPNGEVRLQVFLQDETLWLTQKGIGELFDVAKSTISEHLKNIYDSNELERGATVRNFRTVQEEGERNITRDLEYHNLDAVIAVGYRVNSKKATQFRIWATKTLREYIVKGFVVDDQRLKQGGEAFGKDYFQELLETVRSIRASERRIYLQITDIFAECSMDYNPQSEITKKFYAMVQNKFHFAITGQTAAEIIYDKANRNQPYMGLSTWKKAPVGRVLVCDVTVAKNYLQEKEIKKLERTVSGFFDYIENLIENEQTFTMKEFSESVDNFLNFNKYKILKDKGRVSKEKANQKALGEYKEFNKTQRIESDFEKETKKFLKGKK